MKLNKNSLAVKIWTYLALFSFVILVFLWLFQVLFLDRYYEYYKTQRMNAVAKEIQEKYKKGDNLIELLKDINIKEGICIEFENREDFLYYSSNMNKSCIISNNNEEIRKKITSFKDSQQKNITLKVSGEKMKKKGLIYGLKLDNDVYLFLNTVLEPVDATITILTSQLIIVTIIVLVLSLLISYFISRKLSTPITTLKDKAKLLSNGLYNIEFPTDTEIDEINELSKTLNYAQEELSKTDELQKDLMANVSHDLKTPLTMIKAYAEMIRDITYKDREKCMENLDIIIEETERLNILVSDILDLSKLQSNIEKLNEEEFDLIDLVATIINRYEILSLTEKYHFILDSPDDKLIIKADKSKLEQVIYNLINNAINYTGKDKTVKIIITNDENIRVSIQDSGDGIEEEDLKYIWDKYYKSKKKHKRNMIGTGLGLAIVKNILELHNFQYGVISKKKKGTTFYFEIPKEKEEN